MVFDPFCGTPSLMPARRASDRPMAMACWRERTLPLPWCRACISSRMNSPACVEGFLPARAPRRARFNAIAFGMINHLLVALQMNSAPSDLWTAGRGHARDAPPRESFHDLASHLPAHSTGIAADPEACAAHALVELFGCFMLALGWQRNGLGRPRDFRKRMGSRP